MAAVKDSKLVGAPFPNAIDVIKVIYDQSLDGAAATALDLIVADDDIVIVGFFAKVLTACTSGGSAVLDVGVKGGDTDLLLDAVAVAALGAGTFHTLPNVATEGTPNVLPAKLPVKLASGGTIEMDTTTDSFLTGKIEFTFLVMKF